MKTTKQYSIESPLFEHPADNPFYLFLKKENFFFDIPHYHKSLEFIYIIKGKTTAHLGDSVYELSKGDALICANEQVHFYENYDKNKLAFIVLLSSSYLHDFDIFSKGSTFPTVLKNKKANAEIYDLLQEWIDYKDRTFLVDCAFSNLFLDKLIKLYGLVGVTEYESMNTTAVSFINYIQENYHLNLSLDSMAYHFGYSKEYFSKKFKQSVGKNFLSFLNDVRLQKAVELLNDPDKKYTFNEICSKCGFNNSATLYRHLKKIKQANPCFSDKP
jgi:AraC-like DNA-binding protein